MPHTYIPLVVTTKPSRKDKSNQKDEKSLGMWIDPLRSPTYLAQRRANISAQTASFQFTDGLPTDEAYLDEKFSKRRRTENASIRRWMDLGDLMLKQEDDSKSGDLTLTPARSQHSSPTASMQQRPVARPRR
ncbi:MAG: hypothetical protein ACJ71Q_09010 [Terriglobales bacterium]